MVLLQFLVHNYFRKFSLNFFIISNGFAKLKITAGKKIERSNKSIFLFKENLTELLL